MLSNEGLVEDNLVILAGKGDASSHSFVYYLLD